jgi:hypothetical protein
VGGGGPPWQGGWGTAGSYSHRGDKGIASITDSTSDGPAPGHLASRRGKGPQTSATRAPPEQLLGGVSCPHSLWTSVLTLHLSRIHAGPGLVTLTVTSLPQ